MKEIKIYIEIGDNLFKLLNSISSNQTVYLAIKEIFNGIDIEKIHTEGEIDSTSTHN